MSNKTGGFSIEEPGGVISKAPSFNVREEFAKKLEPINDRLNVLDADLARLYIARPYSYAKIKVLVEEKIALRIRMNSLLQEQRLLLGEF
jgi:hypothetical protein